VRLSAASATWSSAAASERYAWVVGGAVVSTAKHYTPRPADVGRSIRLRVTAEAPGHGTAVVTTEALRVRAGRLVAKRGPKVRGRAVVGARLRVRPATWRTPGVTTRYTWLRGSKAVGTGPRYRLRDADAGSRIRVRVVAKRPGYQTVRRVVVGPRVTR
jgi:hypothetical protein